MFFMGPQAGEHSTGSGVGRWLPHGRDITQEKSVSDPSTAACAAFYLYQKLADFWKRKLSTKTFLKF